MRQLIALSTLTLVLAAPLAAQQARATRVDGAPPVIDGRLDDGAWNAAVPISEFVQKNPTEGQPASERTEARFLYTDSDLYVAVRAFDSDQRGIVGPLLRRDASDVRTDYVGIKLDTYHDRRTAYEFDVNPAGSRRDLFIFDDGARTDDTWNPVYDWAATTDPEGWSAELRIPFSQLRFSKADAMIFGLRVVRYISRRSEESNWPFVSRDQAGEVSRYGELAGLDGIPVPRRIEALPYTAGSRQLEPPVALGGSPFGSRSQFRTGGDLKVGLGSGLTLDATFTPDFGQVEADASVVNLTGFETFYPEKRPFFVEGTDLLRLGFAAGSGGNDGLVYTRRVGRNPQLSPSSGTSLVDIPSETTILGAAKITGRPGRGWAIGAAQAVTAKEHAELSTAAGVPVGTPGVEPLTSYSILRVQRTVREGRMNYGGLVTGVVRSLDEAAFDVLHQNALGLGADLRGRFGNDQYEYEWKLMTTRVAGSRAAILRTQTNTSHNFGRVGNDHLTLDSTRTSLWGVAGLARIARVTGFATWSLRYGTRSPGLEPNDVGFATRVDQHQMEGQVVFRWLRPGKVFRRLEWRLQQDFDFTYGWEMGSTTTQTRIDATFLNYWTFNQNAEREPRHVDPRVLRGGPAIDIPVHFHFNGGLSSDSRRRVTWNLSWQDTYEEDSGRKELTLNTGLNFRPRGPVSGSIAVRRQWGMDDRQYLTAATVAGTRQYVLGRVRRREVSVTLRSDIALSPRLSLQLYGQPFVSARNFDRLRLVVNPRAAEYFDQFDMLDANRVTRGGAGTQVQVDVDGNGSTDLSFGEPDRRVTSLRTNVVLRWEFLPGSTAYLVWNQNRAEDVFAPDLQTLDGLGRSFSATGRHVLALKISYWIGL